MDGTDPVWAAWTAVLEAGDGLRHADFIAYLRALPPHWRAVYTTFWLDCEVMDGGFTQFFWNGNGDLHDETLADLRMIGADSFVLLYEQALVAHRQAGDAEDPEKAATRERQLRALDQAYAAEKLELPDYLARYLLKHRDLYVEE